ncbi:MAG TPA: aminotransferase class III-fold pyridoxal phosphate-dependent enzyme [Burkholderiales bacterium]|nr:aminotransferase class III-fold pyridoxal phosphate-dependent enzyme [Burkholderiales bacterium]
MIPAAGQEAYRLHPAVAQYARHVNPAFIELLNVLGYGRLYSRALDVWVWDHAGTKYLDCLAGFGSINLGHNHPRLAARLSAFLQAEAPNHFHIGPSPYMAALAAQLATDELEVTLFCNSGAEAVEAALKLARAATGRRKFVYCSGGYHGTTLGALGVMGDERKRAAFVPDSEHIEVPFGDLSALKHVLGRDVAAFIAEPIQGEGGVRVPPAGYLEEAKALCRRHGVLFILDEVQTGIGRTGTLYAEIIPDVRVLAKALGGGIASIGAALTTRELHRKAYGSMARFDWHSSTFGGNSFACVAASETLRIVDHEKLAANAAARGAQLISGLRERLADHPYIRDIRGCGLLVGVEIGPADNGWLGGLASKKVFGHWVSLKLLERGIICQPAALRWDVLKIEPPLSIREAEVSHFVETLAAIFADYRNLPALVADVAKRLARLG